MITLIASQLSIFDIVRLAGVCSNLYHRLKKNSQIVLWRARATTENADTCLGEAILEGDLELIRFFIRRGAHDWDEALSRAAFVGNGYLVRFFIEKGADDMTGALYQAILSQDRHDEDLVNFFIAKGASLPDLFRAGAEKPNQKIIDFCMASNVDRNAGLVGAAHVGNGELVDYFIECGANVSTAMLHAAGCDDDAAKYLLAKYRNWNTDEMDDCAWVAAESGDKELIDIFVGQGADINCALHGAASDGNIELVLYCIDRGAYEWDYALYVAADSKKKEVVNILIEIGASVDDCLQIASEHGNLEMIKIFVEKGVNVYTHAKSKQKTQKRTKPGGRKRKPRRKR